jgi:hypothetical protein
LFSKAKNGTLSYQEVKNYYGFSDNPDERNGELDWYSLSWRYFLSSAEELKAIDDSGFGRSLFQYNIEREAVIRFLANKIVERFAFPT